MAAAWPPEGFLRGCYGILRGFGAYDLRVEGPGFGGLQV